jgi:hypothetical protein
MAATGDRRRTVAVDHDHDIDHQRTLSLLTLSMAASTPASSTTTMMMMMMMMMMMTSGVSCDVSTFCDENPTTMTMMMMMMIGVCYAFDPSSLVCARVSPGFRHLFIKNGRSQAEFSYLFLLLFLLFTR